jgi:hypothetical protein
VKNFHFTFMCPSNNLGNDNSLKITLKNYIYFEINFKEKFKVIKSLYRITDIRVETDRVRYLTLI